MKRAPFRHTIALWSMLVVATSLLLCGAVGIVVVRHRATARLDADLRAESDHFFTELSRHGGLQFDWNRITTEIAEWMPVMEPMRYMEIRTGDQVRYRTSNITDPGFARVGPGLTGIRFGAESLRLLVAEDGGVTFLVAAPTMEVQRLSNALLLAFLAGFPLALIFAWWGGKWIAARAVAPVVDMTAATELVTAERLDHRVPVPPVQDEIARLARTLNATFDRLECSYRQALRFSADASHELKTPLTIMRASIEAVLDSPELEENTRMAVSGLLEQVHHLTSITASLLLLARADAGRLILDLKKKDLSELTEGCVEDARIVAESRAVSVECEVPPSAPALVDPTRFSQILSNLLDNAVKYNHPGGEVKVRLNPNGKNWELSVANTGEEIPPENRARLFERFFRSEHTSDEPGCGLGLSLARELARAHGGEIRCESADPSWTQFVVCLPRSTGAAVVELV